MNCLIIKPSKPEGEINAQPSKSYTHRTASIGLLANGRSIIENPLNSLDTSSTLKAVRALGAKVSKKRKVWEIVGTNGEISPLKSGIDVGNSGTTLRFMSAIAALSPTLITLTGDESILKRPMGPLIKSLKKLGSNAKCLGSKGRPPIIVGGGIKGGNIHITGGVSSQFISALLLACPYSENGVNLNIDGDSKSRPYIKMTLKTLEAAEAKIKNDAGLTKFSIPGSQEFKPIQFKIPGDFSSAAFILGAGALTNSSVKVNNLDPKDVQGDSEIIRLIREFGGKVKTSSDSVKVMGNEGLKGIKTDCSDTPDLVPILAVLASKADGETSITDISHLRYKEVDRLKALTRELRKAGVRIIEGEDELQIKGGGQLKGGKFNSHGDHRIAMALTVLGLVTREEVIIKNAGCIDVSYPNFVQDMLDLGVSIDFK